VDNFVCFDGLDTFVKGLARVSV